MIDRDKAIHLLEQSSLSNESGLWEGTTSEIQDLLNRVRDEALEEAAYTANRVMKGDGIVNDIWLHEIEDAIRALKQEQTK